MPIGVTRNVRYGRLTPIGVKVAFLAFFVGIARPQRPTSGLWLAADRRYSVMASGRAGCNQVGGTQDLQ